MPSLLAILFSVLVLAGLRVSATGASDYLMDLWTRDNDLPDTSVTAITQTPDGYLWIGTGNGLARFDGVRFTHFDPANTPALKHARVLRLFTDARGTLWIDTYDGSVVSFRDGVFTREWQGAEVTGGLFSTSNRIYLATIASGVATRAENSTGSNRWQTIVLDDARRTSARLYSQDSTGDIWCLLRDGQIKRISGTNVVALSEDNGLDGEKINCLTADPVGQIWAGTDKRIFHWNGARFEDETPTNGEPTTAVSFLFCTASNGLWAIMNNSVRHAVNRRWIASTNEWGDLLQGDAFYLRAYEEKNGNVWFRQYGQGLFCAGAGGSFSRLSSANGLPDNRVSCWFQDREGNLWIGMASGGLMRLRERQFQIAGGDILKNTAVATICEDAQSNVWIGTFDRGLNRWRDGRLEHFDLPADVSRNAVFSAAPDTQGRLWLSGDHEDLFVFETNRVRRAETAVHGIKAILPDSTGRLWLGRQTQLTCIINGKTVSYGSKEGLKRSDVRALAEDPEGNIWVGTGDGGLYKYAGGNFSAFKPDDAAEESQPIWSLLPDADGTIWCGTFRGGLLHLQNGKFTRYTTRDGLPDDIICQIADDGLGKLWFGSHKGIFSIEKKSFAAFDRGEISSLPCRAYGLYDGLPTLECSGNYQPCAWRGHDGKLWFATVKGAVAVSPEKVRPNLLPPPVVIESALVDGKQIQGAGFEAQGSASATTGAIPNSTRHAPQLKIPPGKHQLDFQFTALSFTAPDKVRFRYRLAGFDNGWVESETKRAAHYGPLPPGDYAFQVVACNNDGVWNDTGAGIALKQLPFFWQTWWFAGLVFIAAGLLIAASVSYAATRRWQRKLERLKQQRAIEIERERIAKDIHDDLGAGLTQIMFQSSLAKNSPAERMQTDLTQISETARDMVRTMDEIVWAVNPENDTLDGLVTYLGKYVQDFLTAAKLRCRLDLPAELPHVAVPAETRHNIYLAIKEALNNVVKHAHATEVLFQFQMQPDAFVFVIKDDGVGFTEGQPATNGIPSISRISSGLGLKNLPQRLAAIGGKCSVDSQPGAGARIELTVPFKKLSA